MSDGSFFRYQRDLKAKEKEVQDLRKELEQARAERATLEKMRLDLEERTREVLGLETYLAEQFGELEQERARLGISKGQDQDPPATGPRSSWFKRRR